MTAITDKDQIHPENAEGWREWLQTNHESSDLIWIIYNKKSSGAVNLSWSEAVDQALCFGWIDGIKQSIDVDTFRQRFSKRKPVSNWSKINKDKIARLTAEGLMTEAGYKSVESAKKNGRWTLFDDAENLIIPDDLEAAFSRYPGSKDFFTGQSKSKKKAVLQWIVTAKQDKTRVNRIEKTASSAAAGLLPIG